jgi:hypothetical protein
MRGIRRVQFSNCMKMAVNFSYSGAEVGRGSKNTNKPLISEGGGDKK